MGLDMYLYKTTFVGANYDHKDVIIGIAGKDAPKSINPNRISEITEVVGTWRKANAIHRWFVEHVQDGEDDCGRYPVTEDDLRSLLSAVDTVLASVTLVDANQASVKDDVRRRLAGQDDEGRQRQEQATAAIIGMFDGAEVEMLDAGGRPQWVLADTETAEIHLPTTDGFFFGSTAYDECYVGDLKQTKEIVEAALAECDAPDWPEFSYQASW